MFKLMKYEFRKWRTVLLAMLGSLAALEIGFVLGQNLNKTGLMATCLGLITILTFAAFASLLIAGIASYSQELNQKSGYLIFMTPVPTLGVVLSKLLFIVVVALASMALFGAAAYFDFRYLINKLDLDEETLNQINMLLRFGLKANASMQQIVQMALFTAGTVLIEVLLTMTTAYLSVTLSATLMQNKKGFLRALVSLVLFVALTWGASWVSQKLLYDRISGVSASVGELRGTLGWSALLNFGFCALFTGASTWLLEHKVNL
ncbi:MAG: hypothetical protein IJH09_02480 [Clostridia bacterium]|nr:hypothetical protein [Clostridia bacterium]